MSGADRTAGAEAGKAAAKAAEFLRERGFGTPKAGLILGSGLDGLADRMEREQVVAFEEIPGFPVSTVAHHEGRLIYGRISGEHVVVMKGRVHYYEGYTMQQVAFPVRVIHALGAPRLVVTSAVGGLNPLFREGDLVAVVDHINLMGDNPLIGPNDDSLGPRFPDMSEPYDRSLVELAVASALKRGFVLHKGVFVGVAGPNLETRAEYRFLRMIGADVVGMSLVPEDLAAVHAGMKVLGICVVTDMCLPDALVPASLERILEVAGKASPLLDGVIEDVIAEMG